MFTIVREKIKKVAVPVMAAGVSALSVFPAFAVDEVAFNATELVTTSATQIQGDLLGAITAITPKALVVVGAVMTIRFTVAFFSKLTGAKK